MPDMPDMPDNLYTDTLWSIFDIVPDGLAVLDCAGTICFVNASWKRIYASHPGHSDEEAGAGTGQPVTRFLETILPASEPARAEIIREVRAVLDGERDYGSFEISRPSPSWAALPASIL